MARGVTVLIPWRAGDSHREAAFRWVARQWAELPYELKVCEAPDGPWCKAAAINPAAATLTGTAVVADADVWGGAALIEEAVRAVEDGAGWAIPHRDVRRLTAAATASVLGGELAIGDAETEEEYIGISGGGAIVLPAESLRSVPLDLRYLGWGHEDESWAMALSTVLGEPWRGDLPLHHLWHPPQARWTRRRGSLESWELRRRYVEAREDGATMLALIEEARLDAHSDAQHVGDDHQALGVG